MRILDADPALLHAQDAVGHISQLEDITLQTLDREILVHRADELRLRLENDLIVGVVGDGAAGGDGGQSRAAPSRDPMIDGVVMNERPVPAAARAVALGEHAQHFVELGALEIPIRIRAAQQRIQALLVPFAGRNLRDDLLREHVQRLHWHT